MPQSRGEWFPGTPSAVLVCYALLVVVTPLSLRIVYQQWDRGTLRSATCAGGGASAKNLPKLVMLVGPEGAGHDLLDLVLSALPANIAIERFSPNLHLTTAESQITPAADSTSGKFCPKLPYARRLHDFGGEISALLKAKAPQPGSAYIRARDPFPMGRIRTPLARPDLVGLQTFHGLYYELKAVVLVRNLSSVAMWSISKNFHNDDVGLQLRLIEDSMTYIDASLRTLPCGTFGILDVDTIQANVETVSAQLASFLDLPGVGKNELSVAFQVAFPKWDDKSGAGTPSEPTFGGQKMDLFFSQRTSLWPLLSASKKQLFFVPGSPASWPR